MDNPEFINIYIEKLIAEIGELVKYKLLLEAKLGYIDTANQKLLQKIDELQAQIEKQNKKAGKFKDAPAEVSTETF